MSSNTNSLHDNFNLVIQNTNETVSSKYPELTFLLDKRDETHVGLSILTNFNGKKQWVNLTGCTKEVVEALIKEASSTMFKYKGSCTFEKLPKTGMSIGDVWNVTDDFIIGDKTYSAGTNVAWNGKSWDPLEGDNANKELKINKLLSTDEFTETTATDEKYPSAKLLYILNEARKSADTILQKEIDSCEKTSNKDTSINSSSTNDTYPSSKAVIDAISTETESITSKIEEEKTRATEAEATLQSNIDTEKQNRTAADTTLQSNIDTEAASRAEVDSALQQNIDDESTARQSADSALQEKIEVEANTRATTDATLQSNIDNEVTRAKGEESSLQSKIETETTRATTAEKTLQSNIESESTERSKADNALQTNITNEVTRATKEENAIYDTLDSEIDRAENAESTLQDNIDAEAEARNTAISTAISSEVESRNVAITTAITSEVTARQKADTEVTGKVTEEVTARKAADESLQDNIDNEASRATIAESTLQTNIDNIASTISQETTDRKAADAEIVASIQSFQSDLNTEVTARNAADKTLQDNIDAEVSSRKNNDSTLDKAITTEKNRATEAETTLQTNINNEASTRESADSSLQSKIEAEAEARADADAKRDTDISNEASARESADNTLQTNIDNEASTRESADNTLDGKISANATAISTEATDRATAISTEATDRATADNTLQTNIDNEASARESADNELDEKISANTTAISTEATDRAAAISTEASSRESADNTLQTNIDNEASARESADNDLQSNIDTCEKTANKVTAALSTESTDTQYPSAKLIYNTLLKYLKTTDMYTDTYIQSTAVYSKDNWFNSVAVASALRHSLSSTVDAVIDGSSVAADSYYVVGHPISMFNSDRYCPVILIISNYIGEYAIIGTAYNSISYIGGNMDLSMATVTVGNVTIRTLIKKSSADSEHDKLYIRCIQTTHTSSNYSSSYYTFPSNLPTSTGGYTIERRIYSESYDHIFTQDSYALDITSSNVTVTNLYKHESTSNKVTSLSSTSTDSQYASAKATYDADQVIQTNITTEATTRKSADDTLQSNIDKCEKTSNKTTSLSSDSTDAQYASAKATYEADAALQDNIDAEATARENADKSLQANIDKCEKTINKTTIVNASSTDMQYPTAKAVQTAVEAPYTYESHQYSNKYGFVGIFQNTNNNTYEFTVNPDKTGYWTNTNLSLSNYKYYADITESDVYVSIALFKSTAGTQEIELWYDDDSHHYTYEVIENTGTSGYTYVVKSPGAPDAATTKYTNNDCTELLVHIINKKGHTLHTRFIRLLNNDGNENKFCIHSTLTTTLDTGDIIWEKYRTTESDFPIELYTYNSKPAAFNTFKQGYDTINYSMLKECLGNASACTSDSFISITPSGGDSIDVTPTDSLFSPALVASANGLSTFTVNSTTYTITDKEIKYKESHVISWIHISLLSTEQTLDEEKESLSNKVTTISSSSTDDQYASAKATYTADAALQTNIDKCEKTANKVTTIEASTTFDDDTKYPSAKAIKAYVDSYITDMIITIE